MTRVARASGLIAVLVGVMALLASAGSGAGGNVGWSGFGNTPDENRHSPLTDINKGNIDQLGRLFTLNFNTYFPGTRRGEQSFPVVVGDTMYVTTNEGNTYALDATTGAKKWLWSPTNIAVFNKAGIVANRGVAVCDGHVFVLNIDMTINMLDQNTGQLLKRVPISEAVPGATSAYGYSETSAPICANHRLIVGAAGSEYGVRGFVMAYRTSDLAPAWANPFWSIPPTGTEWRRPSRVIGGGVTWTPTTVDTSTNTLYFGTGSATPLYYPAIRPGNSARTDSLVAVDLRTGNLKWWRQQMAHNEWSYDTAQPPMVYTAKVGGHTRKVVSVATMEGVWFCYDAKTGQPIYQRVKVIDRSEHPPLQAGKPVVVYPGSIGGLNYSPASFDPATNYIFNAAAETAAVMIQVKLTPQQKKRKLLEGDVFLGLINGEFGSYLPGWHDHGSISAIDVNTGKQVWKFQTPEPERGGVTTTAAGIGFAGGGDGNLRAFDTKTGTVLWKFQAGAQIAAGPSIYSVAGKEYLAITVGGTPTSSNGGTVSQLQVFGLGGSQKESPPPTGLPADRVLQSWTVLQGSTAPNMLFSSTRAVAPTTHARRAKRQQVKTYSALGDPRIATQAAIVARPWSANSNNTQLVFGHVYLGNTPVVGARLRVDRFPLPAATGPQGGFSYPIDVTAVGRHLVRVANSLTATVNGRRLTADERKALANARAGFSVGYKYSDLKATRQSNGSVLVSGRITDFGGTPPVPVSLFTYRLTGTITDANGKPVENAYVVARTNDRDFWTFSGPSDANGHYTSFFHASDETDADPVPLSIGVALGTTSYGGNLGTVASFTRDQSATLDIQLGKGTSYTLAKPATVPGGIYEGVAVGVTVNGKVVKPLTANWPDASGRFSFVLPASVAGKTLRFWQNQRQFFSSFTAKAGGRIDLTSWPAALGPFTPAGLASVKAP
ncbi:MAG: outer membrane protein assembly factor BamB family protein [Gaiellaceae bacterium]